MQAAIASRSRRARPSHLTSILREGRSYLLVRGEFPRIGFVDGLLEILELWDPPSEVFLDCSRRHIRHGAAGWLGVTVEPGLSSSETRNVIVLVLGMITVAGK
jgi:hypothetical protein